MPSGNCRGTLIVSIDLELDLEQRARSFQRRLENLTQELLEQCEQYQLPVTWAVADPAHSAATDSILRSRVSHEIAILGDSTWVGPGAGRTRFAHELKRRLKGARSAELSVSSLVLRNVEMVDHFDLLAKYNISALRDAMEPTSSQQQGRPRLSRFGLLRMTPTIPLPDSSSWWSGGGAMTGMRAINRGITNNEIIHLVIDAPKLAGPEALSFKPIQRVLYHVHRQHERKRLVFETMSSLTRRVTRPRISQPMRSILRPAA